MVRCASALPRVPGLGCDGTSYNPGKDPRSLRGKSQNSPATTLDGSSVVATPVEGASRVVACPGGCMWDSTSSTPRPYAIPRDKPQDLGAACPPVMSIPDLHAPYAFVSLTFISS
ncbi:hypothetical protein Y1Q_0022833 [Alligator mississippiensis]|uniref:Uncharacterized protein n=1 Tax=Alligator mississippiensis TaxID=8496 RepID=A0A151N4P0_ALLMI|nr:hypothetical protein Y1Q_0022833 [Alligator mississippiensis]